MAEKGIGAFSSIDFEVAVRNYERCSDVSPAGSSRFGWCLQMGLGIPIDFTIAAEFLKKSADSDDADGANSFGCCLEQGRGVDANIDLAIRYYRKAASQFHPDGIYNFGRCLEYGKGIDQNLHRVVKCYRLSAELNNAAAQNSFGIFLERGIGVQKNLLLAAQHYQRAAHQGHPDGANNFGFCLEHGRGVEQNIELATEYYKFAADCGHSEAKLNHNRCLRLLDRWEPPDLSSEIVSHPPSLDRLFNLFSGLIENPEPLDDDNVRLLNSFERLRTPTEISIISDSSVIKWISDEIGIGDSSVVKLSLDSKSQLIAVKTSLNPRFAELIRREAVILKTVKHPLIVELVGDISDTPDHNSVIVTEFAGNGSLANHLSSAKCPLSDSNKIARIIVGIALAMRFLHSRGFVHCDLKPENILLDWNWNVRIADFGQSISLNNPEISSLIHPNVSEGMLFADSHYLAPECYENRYSQMSDVFSFGLILYELLTGQPVFSKELAQIQIACMVAVKHELPDIPNFVFPSARELITECWSEEPGDRPFFDEIVDRLKEMKFKVMPNVNSSKLATFVKEIERLESQNPVVPQ
jgi:TPR repeat protein